MRKFDLYLKEKGAIGAWIWVELVDDVSPEIVKQVLRDRFEKLLESWEKENEID